MALLIKGFKKQSILSVPQITQIVAQIPNSHLRGISAIVYDPTRFFQRSYAAPKSINYRAAGEYDSMPMDHILVYKFDSIPQFKHILFHEIGHHVFKRFMDSSQRKQWVTQVSGQQGYVSDYARTNANEDFAECYAFYQRVHSPLRKLPLKYNFIKGLF